MAQKTVVTLVDDLTGEEGNDINTVEFAVDGVSYEVDLGEENAAEFRDFLSAYIDAGRRVGGRAKRGAGRKTSSGTGYSREQSAEIRRWGKQQGWTVSDRGRIPGDLAEAWEQAHQGQAA